MWPTGKAISGFKLKDLRSLLHLIPKDVKGFYHKVMTDDYLLDEVDGFSGEVGFEIEMGTIVVTDQYFFYFIDKLKINYVF